MYRVRDFMTPEPITLNEMFDLSHAETVMKLGRIRHLPVVRGDKLIGLVTHRDILRAAGEKHDSTRPFLAKDLMTTELVTVGPQSSLRTAAQVMLRQKIGCLPVVEDDNRLVGIITEADLVRLAVDLMADLDRIEDVADGHR